MMIRVTTGAGGHPLQRPPKEASRRAKVDVLLQNHMLMDPTQDKVEKMTARNAGDPNPFVGSHAVSEMSGCHIRVHAGKNRAPTTVIGPGFP